MATLLHRGTHMVRYRLLRPAAVRPILAIRSSQWRLHTPAQLRWCLVTTGAKFRKIVACGNFDMVLWTNPNETWLLDGPCSLRLAFCLPNGLEHEKRSLLGSCSTRMTPLDPHQTRRR